MTSLNYCCGKHPEVSISVGGHTSIQCSKCRAFVSAETAVIAAAQWEKMLTERDALPESELTAFARNVSLSADNARLRALCDEGAKKIAELKREKESLHSQLAWYQTYRTEPSGELDSLRLRLAGSNEACETLRAKLDKAVKELDETREDRDAIKRSREYWHKEYNDIVALIEKALDRAAEWKKANKK